MQETTPPSNLAHSYSDKDLLTNERRFTRIHLSSTTSASTCFPWYRLQTWLYSIVIVKFDIELGPVIELILPENCKFNENDQTNIAFLSFPDTNSGYIGDYQYHFRLDHDSPTDLIKCYQYYNSRVPLSLQVDQKSLFAYVNFRQMRDKTQSRGFFQKSFVILSKLPLISFYLTIVKEIAQHYFEHGLDGLETCCQQMDQQWVEPEPGKTLLLPLLDHTFQILIPTNNDKPFSSSDLLQFHSCFDGTTTSNATANSIAHHRSLQYPIDDEIELDATVNNANFKLEFSSIPKNRIPLSIASTYDVNMYEALSSVLTHIQLLWELVLLNQPIAIFTDSPIKSSRAVQALVHTIWPLKYASSYHPYYAMNSVEFQETTFNPSVNMILGVTNPFFLKFLCQWPHLIRIHDDLSNNDKIKTKTTSNKSESFLFVEHDDDDDFCVNELEDSYSSTTTTEKQLKKKFSITSKPYKPTDTKSKDSPKLFFNMKAGLYTKYKPYLKRDKNILRKLQSSNSKQCSDHVQNTLLRRFFHELTEHFMIPLEKYFTSLLPQPESFKVNHAPPTIKEFNKDEFLNIINQTSPQVTSGLKGDWKVLYKHFFSTENFYCWLQNRQDQANKNIYLSYIDTMTSCSLEDDLNVLKLTEVQLVDVVIQYQNMIEYLNNQSNPNENEYLYKLERKLDLIINDYLSDDMRMLFRKSIKTS